MTAVKAKTRKRRAQEPESALEIIDRALRTPVKIIENGVARKVTIVEAIVIQLLRAEAAGSKRAATVRLKYQRLSRNRKKQRIEITREAAEPLPIPEHNKYPKRGEDD
jgi:hypothetical protein